MGAGCTAELLFAAVLASPTYALPEPAQEAGPPKQPPDSSATSDADETSAQAEREEDPGDGPGKEESEPVRLGSYELRGGTTLGLRTFDVSGNTAQFEEDLNLERGLFLRDLTLDGRRLGDSGPESFSIRALGLGTRNSTLSAGMTHGGLDAFGRYSHTHFTDTTDSDIHSFDFEREQGVLGLMHDDRDGTVRRAGIEVSLAQRDGFVLGTRRVGFRFVPDVPVNQEERRLGGSGLVDLDLGGYDLELQAGLEDIATEDRRSSQAPHPTFPQSEVSEDFAADVDGLARHGGARLGRAGIARNVDVDVGVLWRGVTSDGTADRHETGIANDPDLPFISDTQGDSKIDGHGFTADAGLSWRLSDETDVDLRFTHEHEHDEGSLVETLTLDELMGDPPSVSTFVDDLQHESTLDLVTAGVSTPICAWADIDVSLEAGREHLDVEDISEGVVVRRFVGTVDQWAGQGMLIADTTPSSTLELAGGFGIHPTETSRIGVLIHLRRHPDELRVAGVALARP